MNKAKSILAAGILATVTLAACNSGNMRRNPGKIYAPDMTYSRAYDGYTENLIFSDSLSSREPVTGTVAIGHQLPDHMVEGDTNAYKSFNTALRFDDKEMKEGQRLFNIYCGICHGSALDGNGPLYADGNGKFAAKPANFKDPKYLHMPVGQMYAAIKFGKNMMGSYASQIDIKQRWQIIAYIKKYQGDNGGDAFTMGNGPASAAPAKDTAAKKTAAAAPAADSTQKQSTKG